MLTDFMTYESVRAILGLNTKELPDALLASEIYSLTLDGEHYKVSATLVTDYAAAKVLTTAEATALVRNMRLFSAHAVAFKVAEALPMFSVKAITDGKGGVYRDGNSPYNGVMLKIVEAYYRAKSDLQEAYGIYLGTPVADATPPTFLAASSLSVDPVTGV